MLRRSEGSFHVKDGHRTAGTSSKPNQQKDEHNKQQLQAADSARRADGHTNNIHEQRRHQHLPMLMGAG